MSKEKITLLFFITILIVITTISYPIQGYTQHANVSEITSNNIRFSHNTGWTVSMNSKNTIPESDDTPTIKAVSPVMLVGGEILDDFKDTITDYIDSILIGSIRAFAFIPTENDHGFSNCPDELKEVKNLEKYGWLVCDGRTLRREDYPDLYNKVIKDTWGAGDGATTFKIPDLRGQFLKGLDDMKSDEGGAGRDLDDPNRKIGVAYNQISAIQGHKHLITNTGNNVTHYHNDSAGNHRHEISYSNGYDYGASIHAGVNANTGNNDSPDIYKAVTLSISRTTVEITLQENTTIGIQLDDLREGTSAFPSTRLSSTENQPKNLQVIYCIKAKTP
jgi:microcystin-dependent protein